VAGVKELRVRIKSVGSIRQITRAMEMVATTKLRRFQARAVASRPYAEEISGLVGRLAAMLGGDLAGRPLFERGAGDRTLLLLVSSDRGLCGAYNSSLFRAFEPWVRKNPDRPYDILVYGKKAHQFLIKRGYPVIGLLDEPRLEAIDYHNAGVTARMLELEFLSGRYSDVWVLSTRFESMARYVPEFWQFLPIEAAALGVDEGPEEAGADLILEPDPASIFDLLIPRYLRMRIYNALIEALTSEYASRRFAMKNATDAATDMQAALRGVYNRKRQENITKELLDIVGGSEALR